MILLEAKNIQKKYGNLEVLRGIDLNISKGEIVAIVGSSGAGKTTLLQIISSLDKPDQGDVLLNGKSIVKLNAGELANLRNQRFGYIFQFHQLLPEFTALENACLPALIRGKSKKEAETEAKKLFEILGISERANHLPAELSGGEQQRVSVARSLINAPEIVFADEPSGNLDSNSAEALHQLFFTLRKELNQTFVLVTHNQDLANRCDRKIEMADGLLVADAIGTHE
jgi:lipoprotein-releasing system ATP-binding protein